LSTLSLALILATIGASARTQSATRTTKLVDSESARALEMESGLLWDAAVIKIPTSYFVVLIIGIIEAVIPYSMQRQTNNLEFNQSSQETSHLAVNRRGSVEIQC
jgi:hypothetical protein